MAGVRDDSLASPSGRGSLSAKHARALRVARGQFLELAAEGLLGADFRQAADAAEQGRAFLEQRTQVPDDHHSAVVRIPVPSVEGEHPRQPVAEQDLAEFPFANQVLDSPVGRGQRPSLDVPVDPSASLRSLDHVVATRLWLSVETAMRLSVPIERS